MLGGASLLNQKTLICFGSETKVKQVQSWLLRLFMPWVTMTFLHAQAVQQILIHPMLSLHLQARWVSPLLVSLYKPAIGLSPYDSNTLPLIERQEISPY